MRLRRPCLPTSLLAFQCARMAKGDISRAELVPATVAAEKLQASGLENDAPSNQDVSVVYDVGARVSCIASFDNEAHPAEVIESTEGASGATLYYVHYCDCDKRLDEWVPAGNIKELLKPSDVGSPRFAAANSGDLLPCTGGEAKPYTTRTMKRRFEEIHHVAPGVEELPPMDQHFEKAHQQRTKVKNVQVVELGRHELDAWYYSPYPEPYSGAHKLYVCEWDLKYFRKKRTLLRHLAKVENRGPPGDLIYASPTNEEEAGYVGDGVSPSSPALAFFEVDGAAHKLYCQNLCLLAKLFLDHKTLYFDVDPFLFYVLCEKDAEGYHLVGYFSKEKQSADGYNVACILTLPCHQRKGYGSLLIAFSYELSRREGKLGTPERPLSDLGAVSYRAYWTQEVFDVLKDHKNLTIKDIAEATGIRPDDVIAALSPLGLIKYYRGDHLLAVTPKLVEEHLARMPAKKRLLINPDLLLWEPRPATNALQHPLKSMGSLKPGVSIKR